MYSFTGVPAATAATAAAATALPATGGFISIWYVWTAVTLICLGSVIFGLIRLRMAEDS